MALLDGHADRATRESINWIAASIHNLTAPQQIVATKAILTWVKGVLERLEKGL